MKVNTSLLLFINISSFHAYLGEVWEHAVPSGHLLTCEAVLSSQHCLAQGTQAYPTFYKDLQCKAMPLTLMRPVLKADHSTMRFHFHWLEIDLQIWVNAISITARWTKEKKIMQYVRGLFSQHLFSCKCFHHLKCSYLR